MNDRVLADALQSTKMALLPLSPQEAWMEALIERLPRRLIPVRLVPGHQIEVVNELRGEYRSLGDTPYFDLQFAAGDLDGAWLYLEGALVRNSGSRQARLEGQMAGGLGSTCAWPITTNLRGTIREVVFLPDGIRQLRWIPTTSRGFFSQTPLLVHKIGGIESGLRRWHRVLLEWRKARRRAESDREQLSPWRALFDLQRAYRQTAVIRAAAARGDDYPALLARQERMAKVQIARSQARLRTMAQPPSFTIVISVPDSDAGSLSNTIESVRQQIYPHWELLLVVRSTHSQVVHVGPDTGDPRVRWFERSVGGSEHCPLNDALDAARGDFVGMLHMGDSLRAASLLEVAMAFVENPESDVVYGDDDSINLQGQRVLPRFKPDWNPDLLLSTNYVGLPVFFRTAVARTHGGFSPTASGAESYDLLLRLMVRHTKLNVLHVPSILCSRRHPFAPGTSPACESVATAAALDRHASEMRVLSDHLAPQGAAVSQGFAPGYFRVRHALPADLPLVSLIMPTRDRFDVLHKCIASIQNRTSYPNWELLVVNNGSSDAQTIRYLESLTEDCRIRVLDRDQPFNYAALNNYAVGFAKGAVLGLLNNDLEVLDADWLSEMVSHAVRPSIGAVGAKLVYPDGMVQHAGVILGIGGVAAHVHKFIPADAPGYCGRACAVQNLSAVTGACLVVRASLYREVGGMNEAHLAVAFNDIDFCLKLGAAGYRNLYTPHAVLVHHESISRGRDDTPQKRAVFEREFAFMQQTWRGRLARDPAYNPNLSLEFADFSFSSQPWAEPNAH